MRTVGIDLGVSAAHKAIVVDEYGQFVTSPITFHTRWEEIKKVIIRAREGVTPDYPLRAVLEPTGMAWYPVSVALDRQGVVVYMVSGQKTHDLRRFYKRHSSSDRISARVLAKMPFVDAESMYQLEIPSDTHLACQRGCRELDRLQTQVTAIKNRLRDTDRFAWPGLESIFKNIYSPSVRFFRETWYDPAYVVAAGAEKVRRTFEELGDPRDDLHWVDYLAKLAAEVRQLYGSAPPDYAMLQEEISREQKQLADLEERIETVWQRTVRPFYRQLHPGRHLESLLGVGELSAAVYVSYIGRAGRFPDSRHFRGWHGIIPDSRQSGDAESKGLHISRAGPNLVKKFGFLNADVARKYDPQIAVTYHNQMVSKGKHHTQAVCTCATHLLDRVFVILKEDRPYQLRDVDGTPVTRKQARAIIAERYTVPAEVRKRNNRRARKERAERRMERKHKQRESRRNR